MIVHVASHAVELYGSSWGSDALRMLEEQVRHADQSRSTRIRTSHSVTTHRDDSQITDDDICAGCQMPLCDRHPDEMNPAGHIGTAQGLAKLATDFALLSP